MDWDGVWKVSSALGVVGTIAAWLSGYLGSFLPPPPRVVRLLRNTARAWLGRTAKAPDDGRFNLVLCGLDGDDA